MTEPRPTPKWIVEGTRRFVGAVRVEFEHFGQAMGYIGWEDGLSPAFIYREDQPDQREQIR